MAGAGFVGMVGVGEARSRAVKVVDREKPRWAASGGADASLEIVLHPPNERTVLAEQAAAIAWVEAWRGVRGAGITVVWSSRRWSSVGAQEVPERLVIAGPDAIARFAGPAMSRAWDLLRRRAGMLLERFDSPDLSEAVRRHARTIENLSDPDFEILVAVVAWLAEHPSSGSRIRQLPIRGIDTKWLERHRSVVESLHAAATSRVSLGLLAAPDLVRVRFLDPAVNSGGLVDVTSPVEELAALDIRPAVVFVFENLETVLAMPPRFGAVVVHGGGYAVGRLARIPWIRTGRVVYWGDLDSHGFAILHALRSGCADVTSVLMDESTLLAHRDLWVPERQPARGTYPTLTAGESRALDTIRSEGDVRLEQERIPWSLALEVLDGFV